MALLATGVSLVAFAIGIFFLTRYGGSPTLSLDDLLIPIPTAAYTVVGALIAVRHPRNPIGWIFIAVGWLYGINITIDVYKTYSAVMGLAGTLPPLAHNLWVPRILLPTMFVFLLFPNGTHLSRRWQILYWSAAIALAVQHFALAYHPGPVPQFDIEVNPNGIPALADLLTIVLQVSRPLLLLGFVGSFAAFFIRLRRSRGVERQQMKWLSYAIGLTLPTFLFNALSWSLWPNDSLATSLSETMLELSVVGIAVATGIAILRYRLYDIDVIISRTLVYGALSASVVGIYVLLVGGLGTFFQVQGNLIIALVATGIVATLFQPLRERLQRGVNRLIYGERDDPVEALSRLGKQLETAVPPDKVLSTLVETIAQTLKLPYVAIHLPLQEGNKIAAEHGQPVPETVQLPLVYQGEDTGQLVVGLRSPGSPFSPADMRLLRNIARQSGAAVHAVRLTNDLLRSRQQLVTAREEERRRLQRDLHDGLGATLAALNLEAGILRHSIRTDPEKAEALVDELRQDILDTIEEFRHPVYELRPPALDQLGLAEAVRAQAEQCSRPEAPDKAALQITVEAPEALPPLPAAVEVAAYRIAQEAMTNVVNHAQAGHCIVRLEIRDSLRLEVVDDGIGMANGRSSKKGFGLNSMRERAEELGGACLIESVEGGGTRVLASLPLLEV